MKLVYVLDDDEVPGLEGGYELEFERVVTSAGSSVFRVGSHDVSAEDYARSLLEIRVNVKSRNFLVFQGDVSKEADVEEAVRQAALPTGRLDIVVNDAVVRIGKKLTDTSLEEWNQVMAVNLTGVFLMCRAAVRRMLTQEIRNEARGRIVNISSQHGMISSPEDCSYGVSKSAIVYMTRQIASDYGKDSVICNAVAPGKILTGKPGRAVEPRWLDYSHARTPLPRLGRSEDVANAALFLASDEASFITGENLMVDGGWMAN